MDTANPDFPAEAFKVEVGQLPWESLLYNCLLGSPGLVWLKREDGMIIFANQLFNDVFSLEPFEAVGKKEEEFFPGKEHMIQSSDLDVLRSGEPFRYIESIKMPDGDRTEWRITKYAFRDKRSKRYVACFGIDVTDQRKSQRLVAESQARLRAAVDGGFDAFFVLEAVRNDVGDIENFICVDINSNGEALLQKPRWEILGRPMNELLRIEESEKYFQKYARTVETRTPREDEIFVRTNDGVSFWHRQQAVPFGDGIAITSRDITEEKKAEEAAKEHSRVLQNAHDGIAFVNADGVVTWSNGPFAAMHGRTPQSVVGIHWRDLIHPEDLSTAESSLVVMQREGRVELEIRALRQDGGVIFMRVVLIPSYSDGQFAGHYRFAMDITETRRYEEQLEMQMNLLHEAQLELELRQRELERVNEQLRQLASTDGLTGLKNHREFQERLAAEVALSSRYGYSFGVVMIDVDHFKAFNDTFGHPAGDKVLKRVARLLQSCARSTDFIARYGGEEFAMILPQTDAEGTLQLANRVRESIEGYTWSNAKVTASFGCAIFGGPIASSESIVRAADDALYTAKANGRNRVEHFNPDGDRKSAGTS